MSVSRELSKCYLCSTRTSESTVELGAIPRKPGTRKLDASEAEKLVHLCYPCEAPAREDGACLLSRILLLADAEQAAGIVDD